MDEEKNLSALAILLSISSAEQDATNKLRRCLEKPAEEDEKKNASKRAINLHLPFTFTPNNRIHRNVQSNQLLLVVITRWVEETKDFYKD